MVSKMTLQEARAAKGRYKVIIGIDNYRIVPENYGATLADGSTYLPRAVAMVPRHGNDATEFSLAVKIANMLQAEQ